MAKKLQADDAAIVAGIAAFHAAPNLVNRVTEVIGTPFEAATRLVPQKVLAAIAAAVRKGLEHCIVASETLYSEERVEREFRTQLRQPPAGPDFTFSPQAIQALPIADCRQVAQAFSAPNAVMLGVEGAAMGAAATAIEFTGWGIPLLLSLVSADVAMSMTLLGRHASQLAVAYGYSPKDRRNIPLVIQAMAPALLDERDGIVSFKGWLNAELLLARAFMAEAEQEGLAKMLRSPPIIRLIEAVAERLGLQITAKETAMMIPLAGAVLNGTINVLFQQAADNSINAFFQWKRLVDKYDDEALVNEAIGRSIMEIRYQLAGR